MPASCRRASGSGIEDVDSFLEQPSWSRPLDPFLIPSMEKAAARLLIGTVDGGLRR